jgi:hypothetical protein
VPRKPESPIAKLWYECLGASTIPFDATARKKLIAGGSRHRELNRHIEAWNKLKCANSKWLNASPELRFQPGEKIAIRAGEPPVFIRERD